MGISHQGSHMLRAAEKEEKTIIKHWRANFDKKLLALFHNGNTDQGPFCVCILPMCMFSLGT